MYNCQICNSDNIQSFKMAYEASTFSGDNIVAGAIAGGMTNDDLDGFIGLSESSQSSILAKRLAPPKKKTLSLWVVIACLIFWPAIPIAYYFHRCNKKWNSSEYLRLYKEWESSWICHKCGATFTTINESGNQ